MRSGLLDRVKASLNQEGISWTELAGIQAFRNFLKSIGMPGSFRELGAREEDIPRMAHSACCGNGRAGTIGGFVSLAEKDVEEIYRLML